MSRDGHGLRSVFLRCGVVGAGLSIAAVSMGACGSRGPLDGDPPPDAATDTAAVIDATPDVGPDTAVPVDAGRESGGSILECGTCLFGECSDGILACVQDAACRAIFQCVITDCFAGGGGSPSPACLLKCANGDLTAGLKILQIFTCVTGTCGPDCGSLLGGLLGGLGGGSSSGSSSGGGSSGSTPDAGKKARALPPIAKAFSRWPELCGPLEDDEPLAR